MVNSNYGCSCSNWHCCARVYHVAIRSSNKAARRGLLQTRNYSLSTCLPNVSDNLQVNETTLCVKNVGPGVARKIEFRDNLSFAPYGGEPLESISFLKNGIDVLAPGQERRQSEPSVADPFGDLSQLQVTIPVNYEDSRGTKYSDAFSLDFTEPDLLPTQGDLQ